MAINSSDPNCITLDAAADLSTKQYYFVKINSSGQAALCAAATDKPIGVLQNKPAAAGRPAVVQFAGLCKISGDADLTEGDLIGTSADGQADAKTPGTDTTEYVVGQVVAENSAAGGIITALINCAAPHRAA